MRFGTRRKCSAITSMEACKVNDKIFISGMVIRGRLHDGNPFSARSLVANHFKNLRLEAETNVFQFWILIMLDCSMVIVLYRVTILGSWIHNKREIYYGIYATHYVIHYITCIHIHMYLYFVCAVFKMYVVHLCGLTLFEQRLSEQSIRYYRTI